MPATATELLADWKQMLTEGDELAQSLYEAADRLEQDGLPPASSVAESVHDFRRRLETFRNLVDPHCPAEQAAAEDRISHAALAAALDRIAEADKVQGQLERVLTLRHVDDPEYAPLIACREDARQLLADRQAGTPQSSATWREFIDGKHPLNVLLTQLTGTSELSDDSWAELGERLAQSYGRSLATAVARGRLVFGEKPVEVTSAVPPPEVVASELPQVIETQPDLLPAAGGNAEISVSDPSNAAVLASEPSAEIVLPQIMSGVSAPVFQVDVDTPVDPDLHAPEEDIGSSFLDTDCPFNPHSPSSSLTLALASARDKLPPLPVKHPESAEAHQVEPKVSPVAVSQQSSIFDDDTGTTTRIQMSELNQQPPVSPVALVVEVEPAPQVPAGIAPPSSPLIPQWTKDVSLLREQPSAREDAILPDPTATEATIFEVEPPLHLRAQVSVEELASTAAASEGAERAGWLTELQVELLRSGRFALAYQITRCLEQYGDQAPSSLPLWLVRTLALGEHIVLPKGNIALLLQEDFAQFRRELLYRGDREWAEGLGFFLRAAAIRPAVLAPISRAASMLRAVGIHESLCHLYNYCSRIIRFSDQDQGNVLQLLRPNEFEQPRRQAQSQLVKEPTALIIDAFVPPALQELRNSILERHESAIVELLAADQAQESLLISAGIAACRRAMQNVHDLFDPRISPPNHEPDPRHILNGILLKIPHLSLNSRWEPELELPALETELLDFLSKPEPTWLEALEMHGQLHDHSATERLLELDVWGNSSSREELHMERRKQISDCRTVLERESAELTALLRELSASGLIDPQDQTGLESRLDRLSKGIDKVLDFSPIESQFTQIRNVLERRRSAMAATQGEMNGTAANGALAMPGLRRLPRTNGLPGQTSAADLAQRESVWVMDFN